MLYFEQPVWHLIWFGFLQAVTNFGLGMCDDTTLSSAENSSVSPTANSSNSDQERASFQELADSSFSAQSAAAFNEVSTDFPQVHAQQWTTSFGHKPRHAASSLSSWEPAASRQVQQQQHQVQQQNQVQQHDQAQLNRQPYHQSELFFGSSLAISPYLQSPEYDWGYASTQPCSHAADSRASEEFVASVALLMGQVSS